MTEEQTTGQDDGTEQRAEASPSIVSRTVSHALFDFTDPATRAPRTALFGQTIQVDPQDLARGEASGALTDGDLIAPGLAVTPAATPDVAGGSDPAEVPTAAGGHLEPLDPAATAALVGGERGQAPDQPYRASAKPVWVEYVLKAAEHHGDTSMTRERAEDMTKDQLITWQPASTGTS